MSKMPLNELITLQRGFDLPKDKRLDGNIPVVASTGIAGFHNEAKVKANGVVIGRSGSIGGGQYITEDFFPLNTTLYVKDFKGHHPRFIYYLFRSIDFSQFNVGTGVPTLNRNHLSSLLVPVFSYKKEESIANILGNLDDKIQLNTQTNQTLEAIAQAIFKSWFVDFDPVRAKAQAILNGKTRDEANLSAMAVISGKAIEELSQTEYQELWEIADAFPSELVENAEFSEVPKGWGVRKVGEVLDTVGGGTPSTQNNDFWENGDIYWTTPKDLSSLTDKILLNTDRKITQLGLKKISSGLLPVNTVLLSSRAPVGYLALAKIPVAINQGYIAIKNSDILNCYYILQWCVANMNEIKGRASGTTFAEISKNTFREISIIVPNQEILDIFKNKLESIYDQITKNVKENISLAQIRDLLLPKLLSGEIEL
ncbi:restriction endonuclease subunit S [Moraxella bovoculi]|uniref:restriction endonuclease subunit S n=1 Tax=Moraxella bovoculi TaxID=386891 RepID=UPI003F5068EE